MLIHGKKMVMLCLAFILLIRLTPQISAVGLKEFRAVWVASVYGIDYPEKASADAESLKRQADSILDGAQEMGMTAVILQVRPAADALYPSKIFPWSRYLTGQQGRAPEGGFDPLAYWVSGAHERGLELHAWLNPYRVANSDSEFEQMTETHPAKQNPEWVVRHADGKYYFNPGLPEVRALVTEGTAEIVREYSIDGLHMDDYFYPGSDFADADSFAQYGDGFTDIGDWRRNNVDLLVSGLHEMVEKSGKDISFGVSPAGIWANRSSLAEGSDTRGNQSYFTSYADSRKWVKQGWVDYICPQLYWYIGHQAADYETLARWWADTVRGTGVKLYIGMADYQVGNADLSSPWHGTRAIREAVELNSTIAAIDGEVHFSYKDIARYPELKEYYAAVYHGMEPPAPYRPQLEKTDHMAYFQGNEGRFYPEKPLTRAEAATLFARLMIDGEGKLIFDETAQYPISYHDVSQESWYAAAIGFVSMYGVMQGYEGALFQPNKEITRAEFAALAARFEEVVSAAPDFPDVPAEHWAAASIAHAQKMGYLSGYEDGTFRPEKPIARAEAVKIMNRLLGRKADGKYIREELKQPLLFRDVTVSHWAYEDVFEATVEHEYRFAGKNEHWLSVGKLPQPAPEDTIFISDRFTFVEPELITNGSLTPLDLNRVSAIAVHHMAHPTAGFRDIEQWHLQRGFDAIGYNFWIGFDGVVSVGRGFNQGAAIANKNSYIISIGFQGDYETVNQNMPEEQFRAGVELIRWLNERLPNANQIGGHRHFASTLCPGAHFPLDEMVAQTGVKWRIQDIELVQDMPF